MKIRVVSHLLLSLFTQAAWAEQGCAPGFYPGGMQPNGPTCVPIPGYGTTNNTTSTVRALWANRWGAIAIGGDIAGVAEGLPSRGKAKRLALEDCNSGGGRDCKVVLAYSNQCAALATGPGNTSHGRAPTVKQAQSLAMDECSSRTGGICQVIYSACSMPEQVR